MFLVYEENHIPGCDTVENFALFNEEKNALTYMENRKQHYLSKTGFSVPDSLDEDTDGICVKFIDYDGTDAGKIFIRFAKVDPQ